MFWQALERLHKWRRKNLPSLDTRQGDELFRWLAKKGDQPWALKELYRSSSFSEPTMRACLKHFVANGLLTIEIDGSDARRHMARVTPKFCRIANEYLAQINRVGGLE